MLAYAAIVAFRAAGANAPAAEETRDIPSRGTRLRAQIRTSGNLQKNFMGLATVTLFVTAERRCPARVGRREHIEAPR
jgi:hypothetical protein